MVSVGLKAYRKVKIVRTGINTGLSVENVALHQLSPLNLSEIFSPERPTKQPPTLGITMLNKEF